MMIDPPRDHHTEALHPTKENHWRYHWFNVDYHPSPTYLDIWEPSCEDKGCGHWNRCYDCNEFPATLLVDKAEFLARKELEEEYPETPHPNPSLLRPHRFYYGTDVDDQDDPESKKFDNWRLTKDRRVSKIALSIASDPTKTSNKEDRATIKQVKTELTQRRYYHHQQHHTKITPQNKENAPPPQKKSNKRIATSPPKLH
jgi:hypothetical protein